MNNLTLLIVSAFLTITGLWCLILGRRKARSDSGKLRNPIMRTLSFRIGAVMITVAGFGLTLVFGAILFGLTRDLLSGKIGLN